MAKRREFNVFSLSFLDIMSCGFGAVILIFIVIHHGTESQSRNVNVNLVSKANELKQDVAKAKLKMSEVRNSLKQTDDDISRATDRSLDLTRQISELQSRIEALSMSGASKSEEIEKLKQELRKLQEENASLKGSVAGEEEAGSSLRSFVGQGNRQYLTGMRMGGTHILILLDSSASMLHQTIVNAVRLSNMDDASKLQAVKWQRAVRTVEWIMANLPPDAKFQLYDFNTDAVPVIPGTDGKWLNAVDRQQTDKAVADLKKVIPAHGTSLVNSFAVAGKLTPRPDNIFLITDGLPTQGEKPGRSATISSPGRVKLFSAALDQLPQDIPVNVILFPMEGDPLAAPYFWILAQVSAGSFLSPSKDWP